MTQSRSKMPWFRKQQTRSPEVKGSNSRATETAAPPRLYPLGGSRLAAVAINSMLLPTWQAGEEIVNAVRNAALKAALRRFVELYGTAPCIHYDLPPSVLGLKRGWLTPPLQAGEWTTYFDILVAPKQIWYFWGLSVESENPTACAVEFYVGGVVDTPCICHLELEKLYSYAPVIRSLSIDLEPDLCFQIFRMEGVFMSPIIVSSEVRMRVAVQGRGDNPDGERLCLYSGIAVESRDHRSPQI